MQINIFIHSFTDHQLQNIWGSIQSSETGYLNFFCCSGKV